MKKNSNYQTAISVLSYAREDHFDGVNTLYRLGAILELDSSMSQDGLERYLKKLKKQLEELSICPNRILISGNHVEIDWYPKGYQMVMNRGQYAGLFLEFAKYLNECPIQNIRIGDGCVDDDPDDLVKSALNGEINFFPEFNEKCFGIQDGESIEILNCNPNYGISELWR
ncbi:hypothetical protein P5808_13845 [Bacillus cereus]|uniref:hypothetical protein n=1 Tax=Bacillus cereus TaxID=1396 RepID=UPI0024054364|nr:hypothetical protein [Bacillus cereus]MDF9506475.1 hypothetical protein [Bacillus cereus]MDF9595106.1 hypothetical protein [Bacillus cereus]MDF9606982.1 hypothetical protein [Bacillus cereus]MDF9657904.1 hypothetical protein [Bacillus cereus]